MYWLISRMGNTGLLQQCYNLKRDCSGIDLWRFSRARQCVSRSIAYYNHPGNYCWFMDTWSISSRTHRCIAIIYQAAKVFWSFHFITTKTASKQRWAAERCRPVGRSLPISNFILFIFYQSNSFTPRVTSASFRSFSLSFIWILINYKIQAINLIN